MTRDYLSEWPRENAVTFAIAETLVGQGIRRSDIKAHFDRQRGVDVIAGLPNGLTLICESKGEPPNVRTFGPKKGQTKDAGSMTTDRGINLRDGLGLLIGRMREPTAVFALAVPLTHDFYSLLKRALPLRVRKLLKIHVLLAEKSGTVRHLPPGDDYPDESASLGTLAVALLDSGGSD